MGISAGEEKEKGTESISSNNGRKLSEPRRDMDFQMHGSKETQIG